MFRNCDLFFILTLFVTSCGAPGGDAPPGGERILTPLSDIRYTLDPYDFNPLVAAVAVTHDDLAPGAVERITVTVKGQGEGAEDFTGTLRPRSEAYQTNFDMDDLLEDGEVGIPVLGLYPGVDNEVEFELLTDTRAFTGSARIPAAPVPFTATEEVSVDLPDPDAVAPGWIHINNRVYDNRGRLRWVADGTQGRITNMRESGLIITWNIDERTVMGKLVYGREAILPEPFYVHHDSIEIPNGDLIACAGNNETEILHGDGTAEISKSDTVLELDAETSEIVNRWDLREFLDVDRYTLASPRPDWAHMNTVAYDALDDSIIVSNRYQGVLKMTRNGRQGDAANQGKALVWILAPHLDWGMAGWNGGGEIDPNDYLLTAVDSDGEPYAAEVQDNLAAPDPARDPFHWPVGQHGLRIIHREEGIVHLMMFDNFASTIFDGPGTTNNALKRDTSNDRGRYSLLVVYEIDEAAMTVRQIWSWGEDDPDLFGSFASGVNLFENGNRFVISNGVDMANTRENPMNPQAVELTPDGEVVFRLQIRETELDAYRGGRIDLYHPERKEER